jgi:hydrogenase expression/formation protein HypD
VFFAIGFETTTPPTALAIRLAARKQLSNFSVFCNHVLTPAAMRAILTSKDDRVELDGFVGPSHVSAVIGVTPYRFVATEFEKPLVVTGFEPLDVMQAIVMLTTQVNEGRCEIENQYGRAVSPQGNLKAQAETADIFDLRESFEWRGLGEVPASALRLRETYAQFDAERRFAVETPVARDNPACECGAILRGAKRPHDCKLFGTVCTPETPIGSCMVSSEGACAAQWTYRRFDEPTREERMAS